MSTIVARPATPATPQKTSSVPSTPVTGTWKHPQLDEIIRRQNASNFTDRNMRTLAYNCSGIITVWALGRWLENSLPSLALNIKALNPYAGWAYYLLNFVFVYNVLMALLPLFRSPDLIEDIPLTPAQRKILGLPPSSKPETKEAAERYVTPPRYARTPTPVSGSPNSRGSAQGSPLSYKGSPLSGSVSGSPFSPGASPLLQKAIGGGVNGMRRHSYGSPSPLGPGASRINLPEVPGTPSPAPKAPSVGLNSKWLYDKGRRNSGNTRPYS